MRCAGRTRFGTKCQAKLRRPRNIACRVLGAEVPERPGLLTMWDGSGKGGQLDQRRGKGVTGRTLFPETRPAVRGIRVGVIGRRIDKQGTVGVVSSAEQIGYVRRED